MITLVIASSVLLIDYSSSGNREEIKWIVSGAFLSLLLVFIILKILSCSNFCSKYLYYTENIIIIVSIVECSIAILQYIGIIERYNKFSIGTFENNAGLISFLCLSFPLGVVRNTRKILSLSPFLIIAKSLTFIAILLCESRLGVLCLIITCILSAIKNFNYRTIGFIIVFVVIITISMARLTKQESSEGRLFILQQSIEMICEKPLTGWGINGFAHNYMSKQANFFMEHPKNKACQYADNIHHPLNEYVRLLVDYGIPFFCLLMIIIGLGLFNLFKKLKNNINKQGLIIIIVFLILSFFSYPLSYPFSWIILCYSILLVIRIPVISNKTLSILLFPLALIVFMLHIFCLCKIMENIQLKSITHDAKNKKYGKVISAYNNLYEHKKDDCVFLYAYSAILMDAGIYDKAEIYAEKCSRLYSDYNVCILNGDIKKCRGNYNAAIKNYLMAHYMCPSKITPLYNIMQTYRLNGDIKNSLMVAKQIIKYPIKVHSLITDEMIKDTKKFLYRFQQRNSLPYTL